MLRGLGVLWAGPGSLAGLALILAARAVARSSLRRHRGTLEACGAGIATILDRLGPRGRLQSITLGHVILARNEEALDLYREHERVHVRQWSRWGPLFLLAYPVASLWAMVRGRGAYRGNRFEREAWRAGRRERSGGRAAQRPNPLLSERGTPPPMPPDTRSRP